MTSTADIHNMLAGLRREFINELASRLDEVETRILALATEPGHAELYRQIHSLKGSGGTHGLDLLSFACHQLEEEITRLDSQQQLHEKEGVQTLLDYVDVLRRIQTMAQQETDGEVAIRDTLQRLREASTGDRSEILLVEPAGSIAQMVSQCLHALPVAVTSKNSGLDALELLLHRKYDLVITALETRSLSGQALIAAAKTMRRYRHGLPCILLTSNPLNPDSLVVAPDHVVVRNQHFGTTVRQIVSDVLQI